MRRGKAEEAARPGGEGDKPVAARLRTQEQQSRHGKAIAPDKRTAAACCSTHAHTGAHSYTHAQYTRTQLHTRTVTHTHSHALTHTHIHAYTRDAAHAHRPSRPREGGCARRERESEERERDFGFGFLILVFHFGREDPINSLGKFHISFGLRWI